MKIFERIITAISGVVTVWQAAVGLMSVPQPGSLPQFDPSPFLGLFVNYLQTSSAPVKIAVFLVSEAANAYFFAVIFNRLHKRENRGKVHHSFLLFLVIVSTCCISMLFLQFLIFDSGMSSRQFIFFIARMFLFPAGAAVSLAITVFFFSTEYFVHKTQGRKSWTEEITGRLSGILEKASILVLVVFYILFCVAVLISQIFTALTM